MSEPNPITEMLEGLEEGTSAVVQFLARLLKRDPICFYRGKYVNLSDPTVPHRVSIRLVKDQLRALEVKLDEREAKKAATSEDETAA